MAARNCSGSSSTPLYSQVDWLCRRRELEDMPMARISPPQETASPCPCRDCTGELAATLEDQTRLLYDILATVNALAAAQLTQRDQ